MIKPDSLIFDMDGTLWDNVDTYVTVWNKGLEINNHQVRVDRDSLLQLMGTEARVMLNEILPASSIEDQDKLFDEVLRQYQLLIPDIKPKIYDGVLEGLEKLSKEYRLLMLSNCEEGGLVNFMNHTKTTHLFEDYMEHGQNLQPKSFNLKLLQERNNLKNPVYIGDTHGDSKSTRAAGLPFIFMTYGFGKTDDYDLKFDSFRVLTQYFLDL